MNKILIYELESKLIDKKINENEKKHYHFIVMNENDRNTLDPIMYFFETNLSSDEILNKSYIIGLEKNVERAIPTSRIKEIITYENKEQVLEYYEKERRNTQTIDDIQFIRQIHNAWNMINVNEEHRQKMMDSLAQEIEEAEREYENKRNTLASGEYYQRLERLKNIYDRKR